MSEAKEHWLARLDGNGATNPLILGLAITIGFLLLRCAFDGFFLATWGFPPGSKPLWQSAVWWPEIVNSALMGYIPAVLVVSRRGIKHDLNQLRPWLPRGDDTVADLLNAATGPSGFMGRAFMLIGYIGGLHIIFMDPTMFLDTVPSLTNPVFLWTCLRLPIFSAMICALMVADVNATRTYLQMGRNLIAVDLLDIESLSPFARRGLRSVLVWVGFSVLVSLFWLGEDTASQTNLPLLIFVLGLATATFTVPLLGVHSNIRSVKRVQLERLRGEIKVERTTVIDQPAAENPATPRLANLIAYYQLVEGSREWPIDAANLLRFFLYLLIGLGSWLGGALVERLLETTLGG